MGLVIGTILMCPKSAPKGGFSDTGDWVDFPHPPRMNSRSKTTMASLAHGSKVQMFSLHQRNGKDLRSSLLPCGSCPSRTMGEVEVAITLAAVSGITVPNASKKFLCDVVQ